MPKIIKFLFLSFVLPTIFLTQIASATLGDTTSGSSGSCLNLQNNLAYGNRDANTNGDVMKLQNFLYNNGYLTVNPTGFFGVNTRNAVQTFQSATLVGVLADSIDSSVIPLASDRLELSTTGFLLNNTGYVGMYTRAKISYVTCSGVVNNNLSDNSGNGAGDFLSGPAYCTVPTYDSSSISNSVAAANGTCKLTLTWPGAQEPLSSKLIKWQLAGSDFWSGNITLSDSSLSSKSKTFVLGQSNMTVVISSNGQDTSTKVIGGVCASGVIRDTSSGRCIVNTNSQDASQLAIITTSLPNATVGAVYTYPIISTGGTGNRDWNVTSGTLPAGFYLNKVSCVNFGSCSQGMSIGFGGTTTTMGTYTFTITATAGTQRASQQLTLVVGQAGSNPNPSTTTTRYVWGCVIGVHNPINYGGHICDLVKKTQLNGASENINGLSCYCNSTTSVAPVCATGTVLDAGDECVPTASNSGYHWQLQTTVGGCAVDPNKDTTCTASSVGNTKYLACANSNETGGQWATCTQNQTSGGTATSGGGTGGTGNTGTSGGGGGTQTQSCTGTPGSGNGVTLSYYSGVAIGGGGTSNTIWQYSSGPGGSCTWSCAAPLIGDGNLGCKSPTPGTGVTVTVKKLDGTLLSGIQVSPSTQLGILGGLTPFGSPFTTDASGKTLEFWFSSFNTTGEWTTMGINAPNYKISDTTTGCMPDVRVYARKQVNFCLPFQNVHNITITMVPGDISTTPVINWSKPVYYSGDNLSGSIVGGDPKHTWACIDSLNTKYSAQSCSNSSLGWRQLTVPYGGHADEWKFVEDNTGDSLQLAGMPVAGFPTGTYNGDPKGFYTMYARTGTSALDSSGPASSSSFELRALGYAVNSQASQVLGASASNISCTDLLTNMHRGAESNSVMKLQNFLSQKGLLTDAPTGFYGDKTVEALNSYQKSKGLSVTGMVYGLTRLAIKAETCK